ncbi:hypothetical protein GQ600_22151 [Phytophthora cactorum]|nr:hypothetical protein GQ600_22151 [Phytophthora cactorum]
MEDQAEDPSFASVLEPARASLIVDVCNVHSDAGSSPRMFPFASWNLMFVEMVKVSKGVLQDRAADAEAAMTLGSSTTNEEPEAKYSTTVAAHIKLEKTTAAAFTSATAAALGNLSINGPVESHAATQPPESQAKPSSRVNTTSIVDLTLDDESDASTSSSSSRPPPQPQIKEEFRVKTENTWLASATAAQQNPVLDVDELMEKAMGEDEDPVLRSMIGDYNALSAKIFEIDQEADRVKKKTKELSSVKPINMQEVQKARASTQKLRKDKAEAEKARDGVVADIVVYVKPDPEEMTAFLETCTADVPTAQTAIHRKCATLEASIRTKLEDLQRTQRHLEELIGLKKDALAEVTRLGAEVAQGEEDIRKLDKERREEFLTLCQYSKAIQTAVREVTGVASVSQTQTLGRVYSYALRSLSDTKDTVRFLILVCIGLLEALDRLQERLHLPTSIVKELKHRLAKMVTRSSVKLKTKCPSDRELGDTVADSHVWDAAKPEEVRGVVHWVLAVTSSLQRLTVSASLSVCQGIYVLIMSLPGVSTACSLFYGLLQAVEDTLRLSSEEIMEAASAGGSGSGSGRSRSYHHLHHRHHRNAESYVADPSLTAVVLEYKEKECMVPSNIDRRIRRVMHFQIPLHSFEATVRLPPDNGQTASSSRSTSDTSVGSGSQSRAQDETSSSYAHLSSATPRSIPVSPLARKRVQLAFSNFSDDVLYQARDRLRQERAATLTGDRGLRVPRFNAHDCHEDIYLSCGRHCASKVGTGMYRSVRASVPLQKNRFVYFEMTLQQGRTPARGANQSASRLEASSQAARGSSSVLGSSAGTTLGNPNDRAGIDASVCIGLSTRLMPLNTLVGASKNSVGDFVATDMVVG